MTTDYKDYDNLIEDIIKTGIVTKENSWDFCNKLFREINKTTIEDYLYRIEQSQTFTKTTNKVCAEKRDKADQDYLNNLSKGPIKVNKFQKRC